MPYSKRNILTSSTVLQRCSSRKQSVSFKTTVNVHLVLHLNNYTEEEVKACWFEASEMNEIKTGILVTLQKMEMRTSPFSLISEQKGICSHGLDSFTEDGLLRQRMRLSQAIDAVLDIQYSQFEKFDSIHNAKAIADAYDKCTIESTFITRTMAMINELAPLSLDYGKLRNDEPSFSTISAVWSKIRRTSCFHELCKSSSIKQLQFFPSNFFLQYYFFNEAL